MRVKDIKLTNKILFSELLGAVFVVISMLLLKQFYILSSGSAFSILIGSVNDSIWENIKVILIPYLLWFGIEVCLRYVSFKKLLVAKTISLYVIIMLLAIVLRSAQALYVYDNVMINFVILTLVIGIAFILSYKLMLSSLDFELWKTLAAFMMILVVVMLLGFTINPPKMWLFKDYLRDIYGICVPAMCIV